MCRTQRHLSRFFDDNDDLDYVFFDVNDDSPEWVW